MPAASTGEACLICSVIIFQINYSPVSSRLPPSGEMQRTVRELPDITYYQKTAAIRRFARFWSERALQLPHNVSGESRGPYFRSGLVRDSGELPKIQTAIKSHHVRAVLFVFSTDVFQNVRISLQEVGYLDAE